MLTQREKLLNARPNSFDEFEAQVCARAKLVHKGKWICIDTIPSSWESGASIDEAVRRVVIDSEYWGY